MARPKLKPADRRATSLPAARCLPEEKQRIEQAAGAAQFIGIRVYCPLMFGCKNQSDQSGQYAV